MAAATSETKHGVTLESDDAWVAAVLKDEPSLSESDARRYLVARKGDHKKARAMLEADVKWRAQAKPELVSQAQILPVLDGGCWRQIGSTSTSGFPVLWIQLSLWEPHLYSAETYGLNACYWMEKLTQIQERFIVLFDLAGWRLSHALHLRKVHTLVHTLQDHYPERLQAALLMRAPFIFSSFWALVKPVIDPVTAAKVTLCAHRRRSTLRTRLSTNAPPWARSPTLTDTSPARLSSRPSLPNAFSLPHTRLPLFRSA